MQFDVEKQTCAPDVESRQSAVSQPDYRDSSVITAEHDVQTVQITVCGDRTASGFGFVRQFVSPV